MPNEKTPKSPLPANYVPQGGMRYRVKNDDDWYSIARRFNVDVGRLVEFNFNTRNPEEVNWYLRRNVGCRTPTHDGRNWMFRSTDSPGIIYLPPTSSPVSAPVTQTIVHSIATLSWIDQRLFHPEELPEVDRYPNPGNPGETKVRDNILAKTGYRFANFLEAFVVVNNQLGHIADYGFTKESDLYYGPSFRGIMPKAYAVQRTAEPSADGLSVVFSQLVGCKTQSPEIIGCREAVKKTNTMFGIRPGWGGPMGVQLQQSACKVGITVAENFRVFPPIWSELKLTLYSDGNFEGSLLRHSLFPSITLYEQNYTVERLTFNSTKYRQTSSFDARANIDKWRSDGWGPGQPSKMPGPSGGNPWREADPRVLGRDIPGIFRPGMPKD